MGLEVAVVGLSGRFPGARDVDEFWDNLRLGVESIRCFTDEELLAAGVEPVTLSDPAYVKAGAPLSDVDRFDAGLFGYSPREASLIDPQQRVFLECAVEALENAGCDPARFDGQIGVYAGGSISTYLLLGDLLPELRGDYLPTVLANDKDFLPTRVSFKLGLTGPSIAVQTACSTALVAVHTACQSLLSGECDLALAGAVSVRVPQIAGYRYADGGILSPDGHCRAFDADARGTVFGSGAGIVALKRLPDAIADGDFVHAVVKGSAVNNDGAAKADFTAPSVLGQSRAAAEALSVSGVDPASLSYVEAHGTGTPLGDPIEIAALSRAFRLGTGRRGFCGIGSVKTNVGHADAAAGALALIKTILALHHRELPPSLHFKNPNPRLGLDDSPFYLTAELADWAGGPSPRRAGINCLGMGGTNAFVVVEEAPEAPTPAPARRPGLIQVSARTPSALRAATDRLAEHLDAHPELDVADVAHTLRSGRAELAHRRIAVCQDTADAVRQLRAPPDPSATGAREETGTREVVFLFPGQGSQYVHMGAGLYRSEPVFREHLDRCRELLRPLLPHDLRDVLFGSMAPDLLDRTEFTQPALFAVEYALARLWLSWGVRPVATIGHSLGEYVAACLSGVFTLPDALGLVALRGRLMGSLPPGAMLALPLAEDEAREHLSAEVSLAAVNGPADVVVAGPTHAIGELARRLAESGVDSRLLRATRAFHSAAVEPVMARLAAAVAQVPCSAPGTPFVSNVTGSWITPEQATDPGYWAGQMRATVRFGDGIALMSDGTDGVLLEVGPGHTLVALARRYVRRLALTSLPDDSDPATERAFALGTAGRLWLAGIGVDVTGAGRHRRVPLPTYPFERERYWIGNAGTVPYRAGTPMDPTVPQSAEIAAPPTARPQTPVEGAIATVFRSVLGLKRLGVNDDFFMLGGTSLLIPQVLGRVNAMFGVDLPALTLLEAPTVAGLAERVETVYRLAGGQP